MNDLINLFIQQLISTSLLEWLAVLLAITYLLLVIKQSRWCWPAAFFSTSIYIFLFFDVNLYMESALNLYYLLMAVFGWFQWQQSNTKTEKQITQWPLIKHFYLILGAFMLSGLSAFLLNKYTNQDLAFLDSLTSWFAILATYMVTQKILENWLYWIIIDSLSIYLYLSKGFALTAILFLAYVVIAFIGWKLWTKEYQRSSNNG